MLNLKEVLARAVRQLEAAGIGAARLSAESLMMLESNWLTLLALLVFGFIKGHYTGTRPIRSALQTALIGSLAAGAAFLIARAIS